MSVYDEPALLGRLTSLEPSRRAAFAAACAERLAPLWARNAERLAANPGSLNSILDDLWAAMAGQPVDLGAGLVQAEAGVPDEDEGPWFLEVGYAQNAAACAAYAIRTWLHGDPQDAVWASRQVYEAADLAASTLATDLAVRGIDDDLARVAQPTLDLRPLRTAVQESASAWLRELP